MNDEHEHSLVMPFVVCASKGGPYDDQSFVAGYELGRLDTQLAMWGAMEVRHWDATLRTDSMPQVDLIAMRHGWTARVVCEPIEGWTDVTFDRGEGAV